MNFEDTVLSEKSHKNTHILFYLYESSRIAVHRDRKISGSLRLRVIVDWLVIFKSYGISYWGDENVL